MIAGISFWSFYFRLYRGTIRTPQVAQSLEALHVAIDGKLLIIWDRLWAHRSRLVREHVDASGGQIVLEFQTAYVPATNPAECIWGYPKQRVTAKFRAKTLSPLASHARARLRSLHRRATLVTALWKRAEPFRNRHLLAQLSAVSS